MLLTLRSHMISDIVLLHFYRKLLFSTLLIKYVSVCFPPISKRAMCLHLSHFGFFDSFYDRPEDQKNVTWEVLNWDETKTFIPISFVGFLLCMCLCIHMISCAYLPGTAWTLGNGCLINIKVKPHDLREPICYRSQGERICWPRFG